MSLLFSRARLIASFSVRVRVLSLVTPSLVIFRIGGSGRCSTVGNTGSGGSCNVGSSTPGVAVGVTVSGGVGCAVAGAVDCGAIVWGVTVDGGACGATGWLDGGAVGEVRWPCGAFGFGTRVPGGCVAGLGVA